MRLFRPRSRQGRRRLMRARQRRWPPGAYRGEVTVGMLRNWRAIRIEPTYIKIGKAVLDPVDEIDAWG